MSEIYNPDGSANLNGAIENFSENPEIIKATINEDPALSEEISESFVKSLKRNASDPKLVDRLVRIAVILGLGITGIGATKYIEQGLKERPNIEPTEATVPISPETQKAIDGIQRAEALEYFQNSEDTQADQEKAMAEEALKAQEIPQTVKDQNFDGLDTTKIE